MALNKSTPKYNPDTLDRVATDLLKPVGLSRGFIIWMTFLILALFACLYAYYIQLQEGLGVTGMRDYVSWGMYISNFVFFVAASLVGMLISGILGLIGYKCGIDMKFRGNLDSGDPVSSVQIFNCFKNEPLGFGNAKPIGPDFIDDPKMDIDSGHIP